MNSDDVRKASELRAESMRVANELNGLHLEMVRELCAAANRYHVSDLVASVQAEVADRSGVGTPSVANVAAESLSLFFRVVVAWPPRHGEAFDAYNKRLNTFIASLYRGGHAP